MPSCWWIVLLFSILKCCTCQGDFEGTVLADGTFTTITDVSNEADISLDIRDIMEAIDDGDYIGARNIFMAGSNSRLYDTLGNELPYKRSLESLSNGEDLLGDMTFDFSLYGLSGLNRNSINEYKDYMSTYMFSLFSDESDLVGEALIALTMWMYVTHELWNNVKDCAEAFEEENPLKNKKSFDAAIGYYIGTGQESGSRKGWSVYALMQAAAEQFDTLDGGLAVSNEKMRVFYKIGSMSLVSKNSAACQSHVSFRSMWTISNLMIRAMRVPLIQMLIAAIMENDTDRVELYALAIVPQMSMCSSSSLRKLKEFLINNSYNEKYSLQILTLLQSMYDCLGVTCEDIGSYTKDGVVQLAKCADTPDDLPMAGYTPRSDVHEYAKLDQDVKQITILVSLQNYKFAQLVYQFGKNAHVMDISDQSFRSIQTLATTEDRELARAYPIWEDYFNDKQYADTAIMSILQDSHSKWKSIGQQVMALSVLLRFQVMYMAILFELQKALDHCDESDNPGNSRNNNSWDQAASFIIGSLEGTQIGGSSNLDDGRFFFNLSNKLCDQFHVCHSSDDETYSIINNEIINYLYAGQAQLDNQDCQQLITTARKIEHLLLIPIIQSVLKYAISNQNISPDSNSPDIAAGEEFALTILPLLHHLNPDKASLVKQNMIPNKGTPYVINGPVAVGDALYDILFKYRIKCRYVGSTTDGIDACTADAAQLQKFSSATPSQSIHSTFFFTFLLMPLILYF